MYRTVSVDPGVHSTLLPEQDEREEVLLAGGSSHAVQSVVDMFCWQRRGSPGPSEVCVDPIDFTPSFPTLQIGHKPRKLADDWLSFGVLGV